MAITILLADDHKIFRESLRILLERQGDFQIVGEAADGEQAVTFADQFQPNVVVLDLAMPGLNGLDALRLIKDQHPGILIVVLSAHVDENFVVRAFQTGADAYVFKEQSVADLVQAVRAVLSGEHYVSPQLGGMPGDVSLTQGAGPPQTPKLPCDALTVRERQVLDLTAQGLTNARIGEQLNISARTVETHRAHLMLKLGLKSRLELTRYAQEQQSG
jgi:two-component system, NarL family, response regulator NreC